MTNTASSLGVGLAAALRSRTHALHARAERAGVIRAIMTGRASGDAYALLLRNLLPAYQEIERGLDRHRATLADFARPEVYRSAAIAADLAAIGGPHWHDRYALLPAGARYAHRVRMIATGDGTRLIAHAYVRFLGDLSGGQMMKRILARSLALPPGALAFHEFPAISDTDAFKAEFRAALDAAARGLAAPSAVLDEAAIAFRLNIHVSEAVALAVDRNTGWH